MCDRSQHIMQATAQRSGYAAGLAQAASRAVLLAESFAFEAQQLRQGGGATRSAVQDALRAAAVLDRCASRLRAEFAPRALVPVVSHGRDTGA